MNILSWLKGQFIHPEEGSNEMSESMNDEHVEQSEFSAEAAQMPPSAEVKVGVHDFEAALAFVESGVALLGEAAKEDVKALAIKYL
ncbi:hypothetical protein [Pantoea agglomerans]|uniref:hypothetical protein n=1 Tax=Enterobacter agglomerans TaxID=549 RepID=UPI0015F86B12|nr:hypothetical protein [Pantoea agglomerans]MBA8870122.1 hypothetical protein [Pantoea agglomerans]MBA8874501.1 hypothetical protein [Pantoea agglomerans]